MDEAARARTDTLTARQERFVQEYLTDLNATQAAIRAGYSPRGARVPEAGLGLKICCGQPRGGSSPSWATSKISVCLSLPG
jgi:hypothetical protein